MGLRPPRRYRYGRRRLRPEHRRLRPERARRRPEQPRLRPDDARLRLGLTSLVSYTSATVHLEGRSRATSSPVDFNVLNPLNNCGNSASMSQDWALHPTDVDLQTCMVVGEGVQAVRIDPQNGSVAL